MFSKYYKLFLDASPQVKCFELSCCCRCSRFAKISHSIQCLVSSRVLIFAHLTQRLVSSQFLIFSFESASGELKVSHFFSFFLFFSLFFSCFLIFSLFFSLFLILSHFFSWGVVLFSIAGGWVFSFFLIFSLFFSFYLISSHFFSFYLILSLFFSFHLIFDEKMHLDASCRRLQSLFKPSFATLGKNVKRSKTAQGIPVQPKGHVWMQGVNPMILLRMRRWAWSLSCQIRNTWHLMSILKTASKKTMLYLTIACWHSNTIQQVILRFAHEIWVVSQRFF